MPPHWSEGLIESKGSRWAGQVLTIFSTPPHSLVCDHFLLYYLLTQSQGLTIDSLIPEGAPARVIKGEVVTNISDYYARHYPEHYRRANGRVIPVPEGVQEVFSGPTDEL